MRTNLEDDHLLQLVVDEAVQNRSLVKSCPSTESVLSGQPDPTSFTEFLAALNDKMDASGVAVSTGREKSLMLALEEGGKLGAWCEKLEVRRDEFMRQGISVPLLEEMIRLLNLIVV